ncbi:sulfurtransferase complex subunit TusB [Colwellia sp. MEBiC06753]
MSSLHLIRQSPFASPLLNTVVSLIEVNDKIVLLDDGCYGLKHPLIEQASAKIGNNNIYVIEHHFKARAVENNRAIVEISMEQLVQLTIEAAQTITW